MSVKHVAGQLDARMAGREGHRSGVGSRYARMCVNEQIPKLVLPTARVFTAAVAGQGNDRHRHAGQGYRDASQADASQTLAARLNRKPSPQANGC